MAEEIEKKNQKEDEPRTPKEVSQGRRDALKAIVTVPVLGAMAYGVYRKKTGEHTRRNAAGIFHFQSDVMPYMPTSSDADMIRVGIIGFGIRGSQLMQALGFATPAYVEDLILQEKANSESSRYRDFKEQEDLRIVITAVCDIFDTYGNHAIEAGANIHREGTGGHLGPKPVRYQNYKELLASPDVDAVVIASPDHWHGTMAMDALRAGKHVYLEKPMTWTVPETFELRALAKANPQLVFQLGHQNRQIEAYGRARQIIEKGLLGKISLIETSTNRNDPNGAWVYPIHDDANPETVDWKQFEGNPDRIKEYMEYMTSAGLTKYMGPESRDKFSLERFFRWRCWWDYSTGLSGDLLTHEYDAMNQILHLGIPTSASSSGGVYYFKDGRTVPDVLQTVFEFKDRELTMLYSATLGSQFNRSRKIMGHDATMEISSTLSVTVDPQSELYRKQIDQGLAKQNEPFYTYLPGKSVDAVSTATERYFAERGLLYSFIEGRRYNTTYLHLKEWLECIRNGKKPSCGIDEGFEEAITAHMGTRAYLEGKTIFWDKDKEEIMG